MTGSDLLASGALTVLGRVMPASNHTFLCGLGDGDARAIYKPVTGERPLWDFDEGTLADREYAAWLVSEALGWAVVPPTTLRWGPHGWGMAQLWEDIDASQQPVDVVPAGAVPEGMLRVLDAVDGEDAPVTLVHEDTPPLRRMAVFDAIVNNTDRKGGHVLPMADDHRFGVDHGVCFHTDDKLRTVLWGWAGDPLNDAELAGIAAVAQDAALASKLAEHLTPGEVDAFLRRCHRLLGLGCFPVPVDGWPSIPWPPF